MGTEEWNLPLEQPQILWSKQHGRYGIYCIDFPRAFGLAFGKHSEELV